jgi:hypothetical protein
LAVAAADRFVDGRRGVVVAARRVGMETLQFKGIGRLLS